VFLVFSMPPKQPERRSRASQRVRKPSQRAATLACAVASTTNRATQAAVTEALISAAALASVAEPAEPAPALAVCEVVQEQGAEEPPPAYNEQEPFTYTLAWRVTDEGAG
jgi:hypothetical protein